MRDLAVALISLIFLSVLGSPAFAQQRGAMPHLRLHDIKPSQSISAPSTNPLQQQMREDYATGLMAAQREMLQQNPSGLGRQELAIGHELNSYKPQMMAGSGTKTPGKRWGGAWPECWS